MTNKSSFYSRDTSTSKPKESVVPKRDKIRTGPEKRQKVRRDGEDRRADIRFEINNDDRRKDEGRRDDDHTPKYI